MTQSAGAVSCDSSPSSCSGRYYRWLKWFWLLAQSAMPLLAVVYAVRFLNADPLDAAILGFSPEVYRLIVGLAASFCMVIWIIGESVLCMYYFPLNLSGAVRLTGSHALQFGTLLWAGGSIWFSAFGGVYVTLTALLFSGVVLILAAVFKAYPSNASGWGRFLLILILALALSVLIVSPAILLFPLLWAGFEGMAGFYRIAGVSGMSWYVLETVGQLKALSIWGKRGDDAALYNDEWKRWAAPTVILMILAVSLSAVLAGIMNAVSQ